jgi:hypothetical protein
MRSLCSLSPEPALEKTRGPALGLDQVSCRMAEETIYSMTAGMRSETERRVRDKKSTRDAPKDPLLQLSHIS